MSRRNFLWAGGALAGSGLGLAGCSRPAPGGDSAPTDLTIPSQGASLPEGDVTFRWVDTGGLRAGYWENFFIPTWRKAHPNISFEYEQQPPQRIAEIVPLGIRNGTVQDVFVMPNTITGAQAVAEGWVRPLDDLIPDFEAWKAEFPEGLFLEGLNVFDGKTYTVPIESASNYGTALYFNQQVMETAGFDPTEQLSYEDYREAARKITEQGNGQVYGVTLGAEPRILTRQIVTMATIAGQPMNEDGMDLTTGEFVYTSDAVMEIIELYQALNQDGSFFPGVVSLSQQEAYTSFPQGNAGMVFTGQWVIPEWEKVGFGFGLGPMPSPDGGEGQPTVTPPVGGPSPFVYSDTANPEIAGEIMSYLGTPEGVRYWVAFTAVGEQPTWPDILEDRNDPEVQRAIELAAEAGVDQESPQVKAAVELGASTRVGPQPAIRNPAIAAVNAALISPTPGFGELIQAMLVGEAGDMRSALRDLQDRSNEALDAAIATVQQRGGEVSRDDYAFSNWDPAEDYGPEQYAEL